MIAKKMSNWIRKIATFGPLSGELVMKNEKKIIENSPDKVLN